MSKFVEAFERGTSGKRGVSTGECPGCVRCAEQHDMSLAEHERAWRAGEVDSEGSFSWRPCGICGTTLGGNRHVWHWIRGGDESGKGGEIEHEDDMCTDCMLFSANGDEPESWHA